MPTADALARHPAVFPSLFGVTAAEFESADYQAARDRRPASRTTRAGTPRVRAVGSSASTPPSGSLVTALAITKWPVSTRGKILPAQRTESLWPGR